MWVGEGCRGSVAKPPAGSTLGRLGETKVLVIVFVYQVRTGYRAVGPSKLIAPMINRTVAFVLASDGPITPIAATPCG